MSVRQVESLSAETMLELGAGIAVSPAAQDILHSLLAGDTVEIPSLGLEYQKYRTTAPPALWRRLVQAEGNLTRLGIRIVRTPQRGAEASGGRMLITLERAQELVRQGSSVPGNALITPLAAEYLGRNGR